MLFYNLLDYHKHNNVTGAKITLQNAISHIIRDYVPANYFIMYKFRFLIRFTQHFILNHGI